MQLEVFVNGRGQLVIEGEPEGARDDRAYIPLEDWPAIRAAADAAVRDYLTRILEALDQ